MFILKDKTQLERAIAKALKIRPRVTQTLCNFPNRRGAKWTRSRRDECAAFLDALKGERLAAMFSLALTTGMRPEEYLALKWSDIDLEKGTATVRRALITHRTGGGWHFNAPENKTITPNDTFARVRSQRNKSASQRTTYRTAQTRRGVVRF